MPSLTSLTPVAMPTIERETERGERERAEGRRRVELNARLSGQGDRQASGRCERSGMPWNASRRIRGEKSLIPSKKRTGIHLLNLLISDASLSQHDSASFITFRLCVCAHLLLVEQKQILS